MIRSRRAGVAALAAAVIATALLPLNASSAELGVAAVAGARGTDTLLGALAQAYVSNPQLNAQRAFVRATDEGVPQALSGYRPTVSATADVGVQHLETTTRTPAGTTTTRGDTAPRGFSVTATQTLFNGLRTANRTRQAEGAVFRDREGLRVLEQQVLLDGATAYMNVLRDTAILDLQRRNVEVLEEQLRQTRDRFNVGEVTRTDVAQAESRLAAARSSALAAEANLAASRATYRRVIGVEPGRLAVASPVDRLSPSTLPGAVQRGIVENPLVTSSQYGIDVALLQVKINEGALYPTLTAQANATQRFDSSPTTVRTFTASAVAQLAVPIYQGGIEYALIRQSKENLDQQRLTMEQQRDVVRATVVQAWGALSASRAQIDAAQAQVTAAEIALNGVREEARVGQRTTLDVLNAQQELVNARVTLVTAQRDRVVNSYTLLSSTGRLTPAVLRLPVNTYDPRIHYHQVRDAWGGVRTPDGR
jgi:outer membrane protein